MQTKEKQVGIPTRFTEKNKKHSRIINENSLCSLSTRSENEVIRVNINSDEYFLIENRDNSVKNGISIDSLQYLMWEESGRDSITPYIQILLDQLY